MPPILGNTIALLCVLGLVYVCARTLWLDHKRGGRRPSVSGCASCGGACGGCAGCSPGAGRPAGGNRPRSGKIACNGKIYRVDVDALRRTDGKM